MVATTSHRVGNGSRGQTFFDWITGTGFLMVDAGLFFATLVTLIPWNLYSNPGDFWVADPLRKWAFVLVFHAILVGAWMLVRSLLADDAAESSRNALTVGWPRQAISARNNTNQPPTTASSMIAEEWARRWLADSDNSSLQSAPNELWMDTNEHLGAESGGIVRENRATISWSSPYDAPEPTDEALFDATDATAELVQSSKSADHLRAAAAMERSALSDPVPSEIEEDLEWQWIEAAASAWLAKRERDAPSPDQS